MRNKSTERQAAGKELATALEQEGFEPTDFMVFELDNGENPEIPDLDDPSHSLPSEWLERTHRAVSRLWPAIISVADSYPLSEEALQPIENALAETGNPDSLVLFSLYLLARDATRFTDAVAQAKFVAGRAKSGAAAKHGPKSKRQDGVKRLQAVWLEGNHLSRDECAFDMYVSVGLTYTAAKKALTKKLVGDPNPWPAKDKARDKRSSR
ncbi:hypothetical protein [Caballeronia sp. S22]|uniref:hypothetical protein n=1 Tax=Caballeronia sp. S22 TaxID=3137182 RepID=UPI0035316A73